MGVSDSSPSDKLRTFPRSLGPAWVVMIADVDGSGSQRVRGWVTVCLTLACLCVLENLQQRRVFIHELDEALDAVNSSSVDMVFDSFCIQPRRLFLNAQNPKKFD